ncbi:glycosyltransferase [bacterium LRH843]|nr:glycosyltransferase [bacterium LRH843]
MIDNEVTLKKKEEKVVLLTNNFPYIPGEEFLENEITYLCKSFDEVIIIPVNFSGDKTKAKRPLPPNAIVVHIPNNKMKVRWMSKMLDLIKTLSDKQGRCWVLKDLNVATRLGITTLKKLLGMVSNGIKVRNFLLTNFISENDNSIIYYSYWLNSSALALAMLKEDQQCLSAVSRAHGSDLYDYRHTPPYIPLQSDIIKYLDKLFVISKDGYKYLLNKDETLSNRVEISRLGTKYYKGNNNMESGNCLKIVTCSYMVKVKRLHLLIEALKNVKVKVEWRHIGDGELRDTLEELAKSLPSNISYLFLGHLSNQNVLNYYKNNKVDLFINVSSSEGVPVSIMEALSFGIPIIGTNVGGVPELVNEANGSLLEKEFLPKDLASKIEEFYYLSYLNKKKKSEEALKTWNLLCNADKNYKEFVNRIETIRTINI